MKTEIMTLGENTRFIVTSLPGLDAAMLYEEIYCARDQAEIISSISRTIWQQATSCTSFLANCIRLLLHQQLRTEALQHTALSQAQTKTIIAKLFKIAVRVKQSSNKILPPLPTACSVKLVN